MLVSPRHFYRDSCAILLFEVMSGRVVLMTEEPYVTKTGKILTDEDIEQLTTEACWDKQMTLKQDPDRNGVEISEYYENKGAEGHRPRYMTHGGFSDTIECSCLWRSNSYWDLVEAAWQEFDDHVKEVTDTGRYLR